MKEMSSDYHQYSIEDFVLDRDFQQWVLKPNKISNLFWDNWIKDHGHKVDDIKKARAILLGMERVLFDPSDQVQSDVWKGVKGAIAKCEESSEVIPLGPSSILGKYQSTPKSNNLKRWMYAVAASLVILLGFFWWTNLNYYTQPDSVPEIVTLKSNPRGQKSTVFLPDGSKVFLNSESAITYNNDFNKEDRVLELKGEAFFEVVKNAEKPFVVRTGDLSTVALGTSFNIRSFSTGTEVQLLTGKVRVNAEMGTLGAEVLFPGESVIYDNQEKHLSRGVFDPETSALWRKGIIYFDNTPFDEVLEILGRWYNVTFYVSNLESPDLYCSGKFEKDYLSTILGSLSYTLDFKYEIDGKEVYLQFNQPNKK